jgi:hypothetical protein
MAAKSKPRKAASALAPDMPAPQRGPLASHEVFVKRVLRGVRFGLGLVGGTLAVGIIGYHALAGLSWLDSFHQAALLLSGMGPVVDIKSTSGKVFDGIYALFCGVILLAATGLMLAPVVHRLLHRFHIEDAKDR